MGRFLRNVLHHDTERGFCWWCVGCDSFHYTRIAAPTPLSTEEFGNVVWGFNGNIESPSFTPSILRNDFEQMKKHPDWAYNDPQLCHLFITNGMIQYLSDCTHAFAGLTVPMVDLDQWNPYKLTHWPIANEDARRTDADDDCF